MTNDITKFGKALRQICLKKKMFQGDVAKELAFTEAISANLSEVSETHLY